MLGVLVGAVRIWAGDCEIDVGVHCERVDLPGWSVIEAGFHRWTCGDGLLPLPDLLLQDGEKFILSVEVQACGPYPHNQKQRTPPVLVRDDVWRGICQAQA